MQSQGESITRPRIYCQLDSVESVALDRLAKLINGFRHTNRCIRARRPSTPLRTALQHGSGRFPTLFTSLRRRFRPGAPRGRSFDPSNAWSTSNCLVINRSLRRLRCLVDEPRVRDSPGTSQPISDVTPGDFLDELRRCSARELLYFLRLRLMTNLPG